MKIIECCPFYNENLIAELKLAEARNWIDELHITECNKSFQFISKPYTFIFSSDPLVHYHQINGNAVFKRSHWQIVHKPWFLKHMSYPWENEAVQRDVACSNIEIEDDDIIILSDIDEIIDSRYADRIIDEVKKRGIITVKLHFTMFYFNLFSLNWGGPPDYSFRTFIMTGRHFKSMAVTSDELRKMGEHGKLMDKVYCVEGVVGFHHSWIGDAEHVAKKLKAYAHEAADHDARVFHPNGSVNTNYVKECIKQKKSIFGAEHQLFVNDEIPLLESVMRIKESNCHGNYFL